MTKVAIMQSNYIPWKGYFDLLNAVDHFVVYDTARYTKNDWRNRNRIKTGQGVQWLTIPVAAKGKGGQRIRDVRVADPGWQKRHWTTIRQNYAKVGHFETYAAIFEEFYLGPPREFLTDINLELMGIVNDLLGIGTRIHFSGDFALQPGRSERLLGICKDLDADTYLSGPAARQYLDEELFLSEGIGVEWMDYSGYEEYRQLFPPFEHGVTILDLLFNEGPEAPRFMKTFR